MNDVIRKYEGNTYNVNTRMKASSEVFQRLSRATFIIVDTPTVSPPSTPTGLSSPSTDANGKFFVTWNSVTNATSYELRRKIGTLNWVTIQNTSATSYLEDFSVGTLYYSVRACNSGGCSNYTSNVKTVVGSSGGGFNPF